MLLRFLLANLALALTADITFAASATGIKAQQGRAQIIHEDGEKRIEFIKPFNSCPIISDGNVSQRIVNVAVEEWARFQFPVWDISLRGGRILPYSNTPDNPYQIAEHNIIPPASQDGIVPRLLRQGAKEDDSLVADRIAEYWAILGGRGGPQSTQNRLWAEYPAAGFAIPWSAVFVSWTMCEAGIQSKHFRRRSSHRDYIYDIIKNGERRAFEARNIEDAKDIAPGDIICADMHHRDQPYVANIQDTRLKTGRATHCDIVVKVAENKLFAIGGNVVDGVTMTMTPMNEDGTLQKVIKRHKNFKNAYRAWFAVLRLKDNQNRDEKSGAALSLALKHYLPKKQLKALSGAAAK